MSRGRKTEAAIKRRHFGRFGEAIPPRQSVSKGIRLIETSKGNKLMVLPGVKRREIAALYPSNWKKKFYHYGSGRVKKRHGLVFTAETKDSKGKEFKIQVRPIRRHYSTTHEARMLKHLQAKGIRVEQPLAIIITPEGERMIVTRFIKEQEGSSFSDVRAVERKLKSMKIIAEDLYRSGRQNYVFATGKNGKPVLFIIDVEHYYSTDKKSRLHGGRMLRG